LPVLLDELDFVPDDEVVLLNATGTHRPNTDTELRTMLGDEIMDRFRIVQNDPMDSDSHVSVGTTKSGNDIQIHREYLQCDIRILTGFVEPHFFAGFSGGPKACMPGLAQLETILKNHSPENIDSPTAHWGVTQGNPIWEEIREAASMAKPSFILNVTLNRNGQITGVFAGDLEKAHAQGCNFVRENAMVPVKKPYDIVIGSNSGYPLDLNLYQSVKGMSAAAQIVKDGGSIIIAAPIQYHAQYCLILRVFRINLHSSLRSTQSLRIVASQCEQTPEASISCRIAGIQFSGAAILGDRLVDLALIKKVITSGQPFLAADLCGGWRGTFPTGKVHETQIQAL